LAGGLGKEDSGSTRLLRNINSRPTGSTPLSAACNPSWHTDSSTDPRSQFRRAAIARRPSATMPKVLLLRHRRPVPIGYSGNQFPRSWPDTRGHTVGKRNDQTKWLWEINRRGLDTKARLRFSTPIMISQASRGRSRTLCPVYLGRKGNVPRT